MGYLSEEREEEFESEGRYLVDESTYERQRKADQAYYREMGAAFREAKARLDAEAAVREQKFMVITTSGKEEA